MLRSRQAHVAEYRAGRGRYLHGPEGETKVAAAAHAVISGEMEPTLLVKGGETLSLGGDAVQVHGAANGFPGYTDPPAYRAGLQHLRDEVRPRRLYLGHPYRRADGTPYGVELDETQAREAMDQSLAAEGRVAEAACRCLEAGLTETDSPYSPFAGAAGELGYTGDPTLEPS